MSNGLQYSEGQEVTLKCHNQSAWYKALYSDEDKKAIPPHAEHGIRWKILAIMWSSKTSKRADACEPVFLVWSEHITEWGSQKHPEESFPALTYPRWKFVKESKIDIKGIMSPETFDLSVQDRLVKTCALQGFQLDPDDPDYAKIKEDGRKAAAQPLHDQYKLTLPCPGKSTSVGSKRGNPETTPKGKAPKKGRTKSTASECKEDKGQLIELRQTLCESEADLEAALNRIKRLQANEDLQKKAYNGLKKKSDEKLDCYDDLRNLKLATFNHFVANWENANEDKPKGEISKLKNAFPVTL